jgi:hypothetical protein
MRIVRGLGFEKFGVRQNHTQLVVQAMKQSPKIADFWGPHAIFDHFHG